MNNFKLEYLSPTIKQLWFFLSGFISQHVISAYTIPLVYIPDVDGDIVNVILFHFYLIILYILDSLSNLCYLLFVYFLLISKTKYYYDYVFNWTLLESKVKSRLIILLYTNISPIFCWEIILYKTAI